MKDQVNQYEKYMSNWISQNLPDSSEGIMVSDIDFCIANNKTKKFLIIELKTRGADIKPWQRNMYKMLHTRLMKTNGSDGRTFMGVNLLRFEKTDFYDGKVFLNKSEVDEYKLQQFLYEKLSIETTL